MKEEELQILRAMVVDATGSAAEGLRRHLDERLEDLRRMLSDVQVDAALALDKLDSIEIDVKDVKTHNAKVSREHIKDRLRVDTVEKRIIELERRLDALEKGGH